MHLNKPFPHRIRAYYLIGSYVEGTAVSLSDIDCVVIFANHFATPQEEKFAEKVGQQCAEASPVRLDIVVYPEQTLAQAHPVLRVALKHSSNLLFGSDIRQAIPLPPLPEYTARIVVGAQSCIAQLRGEAKLMTQQVSYPDASDEFFGYARTQLPALYPAAIPAGTKELVATVSRIATTRVIWHTGRYVAGKQQAIALFEQEIGGIWAPFVARVFAKCKLEWKYLVPEAACERQELRDLCRQMLAFENEFLQLCQKHNAA